MKGPAYLKSQADQFITSVGAAFPGDYAAMHGQDLHAELMNMEWVAIYAYSITGRRPTSSETRLMNALWVVTGYPDARIWCNRVAALAGSTRSSPNLAIAAANAVAEASIYGRRNEFKAISFFLDVRRRLDEGVHLSSHIADFLASGGRLPGYGRPLVNGDERIAPIMEVAAQENLHDRPYVRLAFDIDELLLETNKPLRMNYGGLVAAFGADLGFSPREFQQFMFPSLLAGMQPCYGEALSLPEGGRFPTAVGAVSYEGKEKRRW
ncbi:MAG: hypothetical protein JO142_02550 [Burkholderiales bacterium]|nr:hypothetical protein [Burkholderiales bacterium]